MLMEKAYPVGAGEGTALRTPVQPNKHASTPAFPICWKATQMSLQTRAA